MAPTKFLTGELVLVDFPGYGYWPAQITKVFKTSKREVKCFGGGDSGEAFPRDMIYFDEASKKRHLSNDSWKSDPTRKKALKQISDKYKKKCLQNNNDESHKRDEGKSKATDTEVGKGQAVNDGADDEQSSGTQELDDLKVKYEQLQEKFEVKERNLVEETEKSIKLEKELEKVKLEHNEEIKKIQVKVQADYEEKLQKCSADYEKKIADLKKKVEEGLSDAAAANQKAEEYKINLESMIAEVPNLEALDENSVIIEVDEGNLKQKKRVGEDDTYSREKKRMKFVDEDTSVGDKEIELEKEADESVEKDLDDSLLRPGLDESYLRMELKRLEDSSKGLREHQCSVETEQSHMGEEENDSTGLKGNHSHDETEESQVGEEKNENAGFEAKESHMKSNSSELDGKESYFSKNCGIM